MSNQQNMWSAVLKRAEDDALGRGVSDLLDSEAGAVTHEAIQWFVKGGQDYELVCDMADVDPDLHRRAVINKLAGKSCPLPADPCHGKRFDAVPPAVQRELLFTPLNRVRYIRVIQRLPEPTALARIERDLDSGLNAYEAASRLEEEINGSTVS